MSEPIVSVIVPTKNSEATLSACLESIRNQTYKNIELIVVDNFSNDKTPTIARKFADVFVQKGPERSAQVNFGAKKAKGTFIYKVDSDFLLEQTVVQECVDLTKQGFEAIVVHNTPDTSVSWIAKIRKFEVDMYKYDITHSSARFIKKSVFRKIDGFNSAVTAGEDYDIQNKMNRLGVKTGFVDAEALHLGEPKSFIRLLIKYYHYGKDFVNYQSVTSSKESANQMGIFRKAYFRNWRQFVRHPILGIGLVVYHTLKFVFGGAGYLSAKVHKIA